MLAGRSFLSYLTFRQIIANPSTSRLKRNAALMCVDVTDELGDQRAFEEMLSVEGGFYDTQFLTFYANSLTKENMLRAK